VRPFSAKELPHLTSIRDSPLYVGDGSLSVVPQPRLSTKGIRRIVQVVDERVLVFDPPEENPIAQYSKTIVAGGRKTKDMRYAFDRVFDEKCSQEDVNFMLKRVDNRCSHTLRNHC
jgi:kinesin family member 18/19